MCYEGLKGRAVHPGHFGWRRPRLKGRFNLSEFLRRRTAASSAPEEEELIPGGEGDHKLYPALVEFLVVRRWEDKSERTPGTVLFFYEAGKLKACVSDKDAGLVAFTVLETLDGALEQLDGLLRADKLDWRQQKGGRR